MRLKHFTFIILITLYLYSCGSTGQESSENKDNNNEEVEEDDKPQEEIEEPSNNPRKPPKVDRKFNDLARFLAGLEAEEGSAFAKYNDNGGWKNYKQYAENTWVKINQNKLPIITKWRDTELKKANDAKGLVFYPFSGADFLHATTFFPEADEYVMIGLEPIGNVPNFDKIQNLTGYFGGIRHTLYTIMELSFFRTIAMAQDFTGKTVQSIDGTLPVILLFMARTGHKILYIEKMAINSEGKLVSAEGFEGDKNTMYCNKIYFQRSGKPDENKVLYYFQGNIDNNPYHSRSGYVSPGLDGRNDFRTYLQNLDITTSYVKSASYLMHRENFSKIRDVILKQSKYYLQDDSGMPIRYIGNDWDLTYYGTYYAPISLFSSRGQSDLRAIYQAKGENVKPLPFGIGYQYRPGTSNLMFGVRKK